MRAIVHFFVQYTVYLFAHIRFATTRNNNNSFFSGFFLKTEFICLVSFQFESVLCLFPTIFTNFTHLVGFFLSQFSDFNCAFINFSFLHTKLSDQLYFQFSIFMNCCCWIQFFFPKSKRFVYILKAFYLICNNILIKNVNVFK